MIRNVLAGEKGRHPLRFHPRGAAPPQAELLHAPAAVVTKDAIIVTEPQESAGCL